MLIFLLLIVNEHGLGLSNTFSGRLSDTNIPYMNFLLCLNSVWSKSRLKC